MKESTTLPARTHVLSWTFLFGFCCMWLWSCRACSDYGGKLNPIYFFNNISWVPEILSGSLDVFRNWNDWLILWPLTMLVLAATPTKWLRRPGNYLFLSVTVPLLMYGLVYVVSPWDLKVLMDATANRLLLHGTPLCVYLLAELVQTANLLPFGASSAQEA